MKTKITDDNIEYYRKKAKEKKQHIEEYIEEMSCFFTEGTKLVFIATNKDYLLDNMQVEIIIK